MREYFNLMIRHFYQKTPFAQQDLLNRIMLSQTLFFKASADGNLLLNWQRYFTPSALRGFPRPLNEALNGIIGKTSQEVDDFDFSLIESLTASKGFGQDYFAKINGSWFKNVAKWGEAMYSADNLSGIDDSDFKNNIYHIECKEGFHKGRRIEIAYYSWLDRYIGVQSGGSHHSAMLIHQLRHQNRTYKRDAVVSTYTINTEKLKLLSQEYYMFVTSDKAYSPDYSTKVSDIRYIISKCIANQANYLRLNACCKEPAYICFIPKQSLKINRALFEQWHATQRERGLMIDFIDLLENADKYCVTPYLHELHSIHLGDPLRNFDNCMSDKVAQM